MRDAVEQTDRLVVAKAAGKGKPARQRRVGVAVADRLNVGDRRKQAREGDRANPSVPECTPSQCPRRRETRPAILEAGALGATTVSLAADMAVGHMAVGAVVVVQEDLLERGLAAGQGLDRTPARLGKRGDQGTDAA